MGTPKYIRMCVYIILLFIQYKTCLRQTFDETETLYKTEILTLPKFNFSCTYFKYFFFFFFNNRKLRRSDIFFGTPKCRRRFIFIAIQRLSTRRLRVKFISVLYFIESSNVHLFTILSTFYPHSVHHKHNINF